MKVFNREESKEKRRILRRNQTDVEGMLWSKLRRRQMHGYKVYRQFGIGFYIADLYYPALKLVIELDGGQHYSVEGKRFDRERDTMMRAIGIRVLRFSNRDILLNIDGVLNKIESELPLTQLPLTPSL